MDANTSLKILVIVLSAVLALFLILSIVVVIRVIQLVNALKRIVEKAERLTNKAEDVADFFRSSATPVAIGRLLANIHETVFKRKSKEK
ncbi:MAG: hypothetical protein JWS12_694 [Candidatus Saccharibacteria bacterium]|nr:hypothetical protein [Candidatus Saccharibacteria bacterium]